MPSSAPPAKSPSLRQRLIARTADVLAIALLLIIALTMGKEVIRWWQTEPQSVTATPKGVPAWGETGNPVDLEFGEYPFRLSREVFTGDRRAVRKHLVERCRHAAQTAAPFLEPADAHELENLRRLETLPAAEEQAGQWKVVKVPDPFEMTVGLKREHDAWRIVAWASVAPLEPGVWAVHVFAAGLSETRIAGLPAVPVPPGARRLMTMREAQGGSLTGFVGSGPPAAWASHYDRWFTDQGWECQGWNVTDTHRTARFRPKEGRGVADVQLVQDGSHWRGVVSVLGE